MVAGKARFVAEVLLLLAAVAAAAAGAPQPGDADPVAERKPRDVGPCRSDLADDLMAEDKGQGGVGELAVDDVQVGAAHAARVHADQQLLVAWHWHRQRLQLQRSTGLVQYHSAHRVRHGLKVAQRLKH